jgi:hypothetical protein
VPFYDIRFDAVECEQFFSMGALAAQNAVNALIIEMFGLFEVAAAPRVLLSEDLSDFLRTFPTTLSTPGIAASDSSRASSVDVVSTYIRPL